MAALVPPWHWFIGTLERVVTKEGDRQQGEATNNIVSHLNGQTGVLIPQQQEESTAPRTMAVKIISFRRVYHTKVLSGTQKERNQWVFLWSTVFLDKGITIGRKSGFRTEMGELIIRNWIGDGKRDTASERQRIAGIAVTVCWRDCAIES